MNLQYIIYDRVHMTPKHYSGYTKPTQHSCKPYSTITSYKKVIIITGYRLEEETLQSHVIGSLMAL